AGHGLALHELLQWLDESHERIKGVGVTLTEFPRSQGTYLNERQVVADVFKAFPFETRSVDFGISVAGPLPRTAEEFAVWFSEIARTLNDQGVFYYQIDVQASSFFTKQLVKESKAQGLSLTFYRTYSRGQWRHILRVEKNSRHRWAQIEKERRSSVRRLFWFGMAASVFALYQWGLPRLREFLVDWLDRAPIIAVDTPERSVDHSGLSPYSYYVGIEEGKKPVRYVLESIDLTTRTVKLWQTGLDPVESRKEKIRHIILVREGVPFIVGRDNPIRFLVPKIVDSSRAEVLIEEPAKKWVSGEVYDSKQKRSEVRTDVYPEFISDRTIAAGGQTLRLRTGELKGQKLARRFRANGSYSLVLEALPKSEKGSVVIVEIMDTRLPDHENYIGQFKANWVPGKSLYEIDLTLDEEWRGKGLYRKIFSREVRDLMLKPGMFVQAEIGNLDTLAALVQSVSLNEKVPADLRSAAAALGQAFTQLRDVPGVTASILSEQFTAIFVKALVGVNLSVPGFDFPQAVVENTVLGKLWRQAGAENLKIEFLASGLKTKGNIDAAGIFITGQVPKTEDVSSAVFTLSPDVVFNVLKTAIPKILADKKFTKAQPRLLQALIQAAGGGAFDQGIVLKIFQNAGLHLNGGQAQQIAAHIKKIASGRSEVRADAADKIAILRGGRELAEDRGTETLAVYDEDGNRTGEKPRPDVHYDSDWHAVSHVYIFDSKGRLVLQKRAAGLEQSPGALQVSVSGHVASDETPELTATREGYEELGIQLDPARLKKVTVLKKSYTYKPDATWENREFAFLYTYQASDEEIAVMEHGYNLHEADELWLVPKEQIAARVSEKPEQFSNSLRAVVNDRPELWKFLVTRGTEDLGKNKNVPKSVLTQKSETLKALGSFAYFAEQNREKREAVKGIVE
ncbi:MAG: NUDIX domain-containing protein, partial [Candidatus Omnitrophica bacterium]|nr:NUDIX domain-containing protein [Candidatus Omnitrophota bacterium]